VKSIFIFENKGREIGVTLAHPHGQIYAYPFVPPIIAKEISQCRQHLAKTGRNLVLDIVENELKDGRRIVAVGETFTAYIPFFARYPYELHIAAKNSGKTALTDFTETEQLELALLLKRVLVAFDNLFGFSLPYIMVMHQRPSDGDDYTSLYSFHIEFYPPLRTKDKLKYLAGSEAGAGAYINDTLAEEKAAELRGLVEAVPPYV
jgi:UDPglucose--hexose-1-phosphate uridylyltransferase